MSFLQTAVDTARESGALLANYFERHIGYELKGSYDLVTDADRASENLIIERIRNHYPSHSITGEETGAHDGTSAYRWYVDPLDGTTNFAHGFPVFNVTLALEYRGELICGVIYDPQRDEMFTAEQGAGAFLNNRRIHVSGVRRVEEALVATGFPSRRRHQSVNVYFYHQLAMASHGVRRAGAAALDLAYVACGRLDAFWEFALHPWDMAAGLLLVKEAGGLLSTMQGQAHQLASPHLVADNGLLHAELLEIFAEVFAGKFRVPIPGLG